MSDDDDMPPPLEDMTEHVQKKQQARLNKDQEDEGQEIRLKPKANTVIQPSSAPAQKTTQIAPSSTTTQQVQAKPAAKNQGFGGLQAGFFNNPQKKKPVAASKPSPQIEDMTHVKAIPKNETLKISEVQEALTAETLTAKKDQWLTPELMQNLMKNPKMMEVFMDPQFSTVLAEMQKDPKSAMQKYGQSGKFREFLLEFSGMMGNHFESVAEQEKKAAEEKKRQEEEMMKNDPIYQKIQNDPQVKDALADPKVQAVLAKLQKEGGLDFHEVAKSDDKTAQKLMLLINKGVLNTQTTMPGK